MSAKLTCVIGVFVITLCICLSSCSTVTQPPASTQKPPIYPNAQQVETSVLLQTTELIRFQTSDKPDSVYKFYEETLLRDGWLRPISQPTSGGIAFDWRQSSVDGPTHLAYRLTVVAVTTPTEQT